MISNKPENFLQMYEIILWREEEKTLTSSMESNDVGT